MKLNQLPLLALLLTLVPIFLPAQHGLMLPIGSQIAEVDQNLDRYDQVAKHTISNEQITLGNEIFTAKYIFNDGELVTTRIEHTYSEEELARAELNGYVMSYHNAGETVMPLFNEKRVAVYYIYTADSDIEIVYRKFSRNKYSIRVNATEKDAGEKNSMMAQAK